MNRRTALLIVVAVILPTIAPAQDPTPFSVHDLISMDRVFDPQLSPDGERAVFGVSSLDLEANRRRTDLQLVSVDGGEVRQLTSHSAADFSPRWTPDGRRIPLPTQKEFIAAYPETQSLMRRAAIARQPLEATRGGRRPCYLDFLRLPGTAGTTRKAIWINDLELCVGMLAFPIRGGVQAGRWRLVIELEESNLEVPFYLGT